MSGLYYADFISFYSPTQLCGGGTTKSNSNELPISVPLSIHIVMKKRDSQMFLEEAIIDME
ncbi:toxin-antitoxin system, toxin component, MazF domain protein [Streptococcus sp. oral taxon 056 str. F0418]|nr:toxin-antitoxin system, toxin component, MazF domain protein [Streptococcus sp. oral taxon 056 str. F0418]